MKKFFLFFLQIACLSVFGQTSILPIKNNKIYYEEIVSIDIDQNNLYNNFKEVLVKDINLKRGMSDSFINSEEIYKIQDNNYFRLIDDSSKKLISTVTFVYHGSSIGCPRIFLVYYDLIISVKENRYRIELTNFNYNHYGNNNNRQVVYGMDKNCTSSNTIENLMLCNKCAKGLNRFYEALNDDNLDLISSINDAMVKSINNNNDW